jgi:hypothetical protein
MSSFTVLAISLSDYREQVIIAGSGAMDKEPDDTDYTLLISSKHFGKFIEVESDSPLSIMVSVDQVDGVDRVHCVNQVCGSIGILDGTILGEDYIVMPDEYFRRLQIESFTTVKIEKVVDMRKVNYIKIKGHDKKYTSWDGINEILEAHLNKFRAISSGQTTNVLGINFTIIEMKDVDGNTISHGSLYETDVNIEFDDLEPRVPVKTTEEILKDNERTYIDKNGNSIKYDVDNIVENVRHEHFNWRLTFSD